MTSAPNPKDIFNARRGDRKSLDLLLARLHSQLVALARAELGSALRAKIHTSDLLQSAFMDVVRSVDQFEGETDQQFVGWFRRILKHNIRDKVRYFDAQKRRSGDFESTSGVADSNALTPSALYQVDNLDENLSHEMKTALDQLTPEQQLVIDLRFAQGLTHKEIAKEIDSTTDAVRSMVWRARCALARALDQDSNFSKEK